MIEKPLVSIVVPVYKVEEYLRTCVDSILKQNYKNIEILLVDDGSPDTCPLICDEYATNNSNVQVIHKCNGGLSDARNVGLQHSHGQYVMFVDSDDAIHPKMIDILITPILNNPKILISSCMAADVPDEWDSEFLKIESNNIHIMEIDSDLFMRVKYWMTAWGKIFKRELFDDVTFPIGRLHEDEFTIYRLLYKTKKIFYTELPLYIYRKRISSIMGCFSNKNIIDKTDALLERLTFFVSHNSDRFILSSLISISQFYVELFQRKYRGISTSDSKEKLKKALSSYNYNELPIIERIKIFARLHFPQLLALKIS